MTPTAGPLKIASYCAYLASWLLFAIAAVAGALPRLRKVSGSAPAAPGMTAPAIIGTVLQVFAAFAITRSMASGPLHAQTWELAGALVLAPFGAALFVWAIRSAPNGEADTLVTTGAYAWVRHPMYLAFLALLLATGFLVSSGPKLILPVLLYLGGSDLRITAEEAGLVRKFPEAHARYRARTRYRFLPGLR